MARSKSSQQWLKEHFNDPFVHRAQQEGYRSRAVYKLQEIQEKDKIIRPNMKIVELGAAPGGWSQYVSQILDGNGLIIALDILPMEALPDVHFIQGDFREEEVLQQLYEKLHGEKIDLLLSDMSPNKTGIKSADQDRSIYLVELALDFALHSLKKGGTFLTKAFHGAGFDKIRADIKYNFQTVISRKPAASRARSQETYILARGFKGNN